MSSPDPPLRVAAAVLLRDGRMLIARRGPAVAHPGRWELPGGKTKEGETLAECLERELREELGIRATAGEVLATSLHRGTVRDLELYALRVVSFTGELRPRDHDRLVWAAPSEWGSYDLLEPDVSILEQLRRGWKEIDGV